KEEKKEEKPLTVSVPLSSINGSSIRVSVDDKLECKYRTSCYQSVAEKKEQRRLTTPLRPSTLRDPSSRCHKYLLSCREQLGLPPKEKVPIGPNGRKLCRKKKE
ncbi:hypothetical protein PMAYCL1PPCAC_12685, partial [Pristionchus mayeri]